MLFSFFRSLFIFALPVFFNYLFLSLKAIADDCELYPITVSTALVSGSTAGTQFSKVKLGVGTGNYSWLTWDGQNDAPSLAESLVPPGNSENYINPYNSQDTHLDINDWVEGRPGVKNSRAIRDNLDSLLNLPIQIPVWSNHSGQGSQFNYQVDFFATIQLTAYQLNGKGWISFIYQGESECTVNSAPVALDAELESIENEELILQVEANDADNDPLTFNIISQPQFGILTGNGPDYIYQPNENFSGQDSFSFIANDGSLDSNIASVTINVQPNLNTPPVASDLQLESYESSSVDFTVIATDADGDPLLYWLVDGPENGTLIGDGNNGPDFTYIPNAGFIGEDSFTFIANDGQDDSNIATASISVLPFANNPPIAYDASLETFESTAFSIELYATDEDLDPLTYSIVTAPLHGTLTGSSSDYIYTPEPGYLGIDNFSFKANDGMDDSNTAVVTIEIKAIENNPPEIEPAFFDVPQPSLFDFELIAFDEDGDTLQFIVIEYPENGTLSGNGPNFTYEPDFGFVGEDSFLVIANDEIDDSEVTEIIFNVYMDEEFE